MRTDIADMMSAFFSDETEAYRFPSEPGFGDTVLVRIRARKDCVVRAMLYSFGQNLAILMKKSASDAYFDWYDTELVCLNQEIRYCFLVETGTMSVVYDKIGARQLNSYEDLPEEYAFRFTPGFHVPEWSKGAVQYQIFLDRFRNGNPDNDVKNNEYYYVVGHSRHMEDWNCPPDETDIRTFYGGDLQGVLDKLDYLQRLGVEVIYFNPLFISPSSHKYDTQDYDSIDPHFGIITDDVDHPMQSWEKHNGYAPQYIRRITSPENLEKTNEFFAFFCKELHRRGMRIILDGVFNHCGSFSKWMDREGIYLGKPGYQNGAYQSADSPYRKYFRFSSRGSGKYADYEGWWGHSTLPKLNYEESEDLKERILRIAEKWASPPYSIDGWRLDVAADLGHSPEYNHRFWKEFRKRLKKVNPELLIIAEHYGNPADWLHGDEWDTVMNYDAFMDPVSFFLTGMEKHSDEIRTDLYRNGQLFFDTMLKRMASFERPSLECAMNQLSNHDHSRFLTRTNQKIGRLDNSGSEAAGEGIRKGVFRQAVLIQMTWPGAPTIYYADEAGQVGWTDPDNRRTYPWGNEDTGLIELHRKLISLRSEQPVLKNGSFKPLTADFGVISYARFREDAAAIVAVNASEEEKHLRIRVRDVGVADGCRMIRKVITTENGFDGTDVDTGIISDGELRVVLPAGTAAVYVTERKGRTHNEDNRESAVY